LRKVERGVCMAKTGRNAPCPCGSGKKYKKCCLRKDEEEQRQKTMGEYQVNEEIFDDLKEDEDEVGWGEAEDAWSSDDKSEGTGSDDFEFEAIYPQIDKSIPDISEAEQAIVDEWWEEFSPFYMDRDADEMIRRIVGFMEEHSSLFIHLYLDIVQNRKRFLFLNGVLAISLLQAVYYFAEYLKENRVFSDEDISNTEKTCLSLLETSKKVLPASDAGPRIFSTFPNYQWTI
jgi:hypothetical protein